MHVPSRRVFRPRRRLLPTLAFVVATGCGFGDAPLDAVDPEAVPLNPNWETVSAILERHCAPCHKEGSDDDGGDGDRILSIPAEPPADIASEPDYSTCAGTQDGLDGINDTALHTGSMPPGAWPRLSEEDKLILERWLDQGACSPCSQACP